MSYSSLYITLYSIKLFPCGLVLSLGVSSLVIVLQHFLKGFPWMNPNLGLIFGVLHHFESIEQVIGTDMVGFLKGDETEGK